MNDLLEIFKPIFNFAGVIIALLIALRIFLLWWNSPSQKGKRGERLVAKRLRKGLPDEYLILNDIYLPLPDGSTTQIDHIVVSQYGVFVVETKTYSGWIFGDEKSKDWTQSIFRKKSRFQNPMRQNYKHICALADNLGIDKSYFIGVVAFIGDCTFKTEMPEGVVYYLPKTLLEVKVKVTQTNYTPGELCQYADRYLRLQNISSQPSAWPDESHRFLRINQ